MPDPSPAPLGRSALAALVELERVYQTYPLSAARLKAALTDGADVVFGLEEDGELLGYAILSRLPFDAELQSILVASHARRRGLAVALMEAVIAQAKAWKSERLLLEVREANAPAITLYRRMGFAEDGRRRDYYPSLDGAGREDALLMSRHLGGA
ncbi:ribosomal protein S18-alanine N-acetyltransferase [Halomonas elongata]|uniref:[Ribosomal protein bS18]-alanine N-acetyltransferase n=1 Tax=Halomonas elongata (strain ATCC 33173 / DSM 2581 / NBRC 15536 / NCIMB 2198 / 1H9) TaxID=768066 RepID=E1V950_HALED|nr:ribosomal protein S18-alanine N-acetyltransferase [Halomonas elongata]MBW5799198.1 ribosomal protein S18-alanine N-acetyltransferase [Halomonas elongata]MDL4863568.1 ribosomal protein S18-alanine N-acetyltransferase [Halomonas elongata]RAW08398.1 ribosomal-protein-alanine N-acetyltransferase [Halomonas elongata]WBF17462.1 ribosomal protein S18-alanine N-acetyltransferase [Halomonas elongata]WPU46301.1 ribosomal protein S18-alanine N-acetyltransferase [Halomonas elongata DSM 2581]